MKLQFGCCEAVLIMDHEVNLRQMSGSVGLGRNQELCTLTLTQKKPIAIYRVEPQQYKISYGLQ